MRDADREAKWTKRVQAIGEFIDAIGDGRGAKGRDKAVVTRVTMRLPTQDKPEALLVVKVSGPGGDSVGFVGGLDIGSAILAWRAKDGSRGLKWREDRPWDGGSG